MFTRSLALSLSLCHIARTRAGTLAHTRTHNIIYIALFLPADRFWFNYFRRVLILKLMPRFRCTSTENCERIFHLWIDRRQHSIYRLETTTDIRPIFAAGDSMKCICFLKKFENVCRLPVCVYIIRILNVCGGNIAFDIDFLQLTETIDGIYFLNWLNAWHSIDASIVIWVWWWRGRTRWLNIICCFSRHFCGSCVCSLRCCSFVSFWKMKREDDFKELPLTNCVRPQDGGAQTVSVQRLETTELHHRII